MKQSTMEAYAEIDVILNFMDDKYIKAIPEKLRKLFKEQKSSNYQKNILPNQPLEKQKLKEETLSILAVLNYNYWCKDENKKEELLNKYTENEKIYQQELREKYNPGNIFKTNENKEEKSIQEEVQIIEYTEQKWYKKMFEKILNILKK